MKAGKSERTNSSFPPDTHDYTKVLFSPESLGLPPFAVEGDFSSAVPGSSPVPAASRAVVKVTPPALVADLPPAAKAQYLSVATSRAFPRVQQWFLACASDMRNGVGELRRTCDALAHSGLRQHHVAITRGRAAAVAEQDAQMALFQRLQSLRQWQSAAATAWREAFRAAAAAYASALRDAQDALATRRRLAEEWAVHGQRSAVIARMAWLQERWDALQTRSEREIGRESIYREQTLQHIREAMEGLQDDMANAVSWATQQRLHGREFALPVGTTSKRLEDTLPGEDNEERRLLSEERKLRLDLRRLEQRNRQREEKCPQTTRAMRKREKKNGKNANTSREDVASQSVSLGEVTTQDPCTSSCNVMQENKVLCNAKATEGKQNKKKTGRTSMDVLAVGEPFMNLEKDKSGNEEDQKYENKSDDRGDSPEGGHVFPPLMVQTQTFKSSIGSDEGKKKSRSLDDEAFQQSTGSVGSDLCFPGVLGSGSNYTQKPQSSAAAINRHLKPNPCAYPKPESRTDDTERASPPRNLYQSIHHRISTIKRPKVVQPPSTTGHELTGRQKVDRLAGILSSLKEDTTHFDTERLTISQDVCVLRKELHTHRITTANLLRQTHELERQRTQLRLQCEAQRERLRSGVEGRNFRTATEDVDTLILNGELEQTVDMLQSQTRRRRTEALEFKEKIKELQCRITEYDAMLRNVREYWRRNMSAVKCACNTTGCSGTTPSNNTSSRMLSWSRSLGAFSPSSVHRFSSKSSLRTPSRPSTQRLKGPAGEVSMSFPGVSFVESASNQPDDEQTTSLTAGQPCVKSGEPKTRAPPKILSETQGIAGEVERRHAESYQSISILGLTDPIKIAEFIYSVIAAETSDELEEKP